MWTTEPVQEWMSKLPYTKVIPKVCLAQDCQQCSLLALPRYLMYSSVVSNSRTNQLWPWLRSFPTAKINRHSEHIFLDMCLRHVDFSPTPNLLWQCVHPHPAAANGTAAIISSQVSPMWRENGKGGNGGWVEKGKGFSPWQTQYIYTHRSAHTERKETDLKLQWGRHEVGFYPLDAGNPNLPPRDGVSGGKRRSHPSLWVPIPGETLPMGPHKFYI